jgi:predicted glycogen debranching enzyme
MSRRTTLAPTHRDRPLTPPLVQLGREVCADLETALGLEWLETDGVGGYAASTVLLCPTRRHHGLLVTPAPGRTARTVFLARYEESVHTEDGSTLRLSLARYPDTWSPHGHRHMESFALAPFPVTRHRLGDDVLVREILLVRGSPTVLCRYRLLGEGTAVRLRLRPLLPVREADALTHENLNLDPGTERLDRGIRCRPYAVLPALSITVGGAPATFEPDPVWYRNLEYLEDLARGYDGHEDQFCPGWFEVSLAPGSEAVLAATIEAAVADPVERFHREAERRRVAARTRSRSLRGRLEEAATHFLLRAAGGRLGVVAGFPWFGERSRDTFVALPGLLLARGEREAFAGALAGALPYLKDGRLPSTFGPTPLESPYDSGDAALWFALAVRRYEEAGASRREVARRFGAALTEIAEQALTASDPVLARDESGLLWSESETGPATWMDAVRTDGPVTHRPGCAVEVNALWYSLVAHLEELAEGREEGARRWGKVRRRLGRSFLDRFWDAEADILSDRVHAGVRDGAVRPNMVIAAALGASPLSAKQRAAVLATAESELLTPFGLRSLSPRHRDYRGRCTGGPDARDAAYHQGSVWPWLLGFHVEASMRAHGAKRRRREAFRARIEAFASHLDEAGLGHVSEIFDGDPPHRPRGCFAHAMAVGELLRALAWLERGAP